MHPDNDSPLRGRTQGALDGIANLDLSALDAEALIPVLTTIGDAMRLGIALPLSVSRALQASLGEAQVLAALLELAAGVRRWSLPLTARKDEPDHELEWAVRRRDEIESILMTARRVLLPRGVLVDASKQAAALDDAVRALDLGCGGSLTRSAAEDLLGDRVELVDGATWLDGVTWAPEPQGSETPDDDLLGRPFHGDPTLEHLESYVVRGRLRKWVEREASASEEVAADLEEMISTYRDNGAEVGLVARRWQAGRKNARASAGALAPAVVFEVARSDLRAAADERTSLGEVRSDYRLGLLDPLDATASLQITERAVLLKVFAGEQALRSVSVGDLHAEPPKHGGIWQLEIPRGVLAAPGAALRVVGTSEASFECAVVVESAQ